MNEDVVSFSLAMKLKEKGFDEECYTFYEYDSKEFYREERIPCCNSRSDDYAAPTISQVLKWLREEKKMHIRLSVYFIGWCYDIIMTEGEYNHLHGSECEYYSYEEAELAGIEYCLDNLI